MKQYNKLQDEREKAEAKLNEIADKENELRETLFADIGRELLKALGTDDVVIAQKFIDNINNEHDH